MVRIRRTDEEQERKKGRDVGAREFAKLTLYKILEGDADEFEISERGLGRIKARNLGAGGMWSLKYGVHEKNLENKFEFRPLGVQPTGGNTIQGTELDKMGGEPAAVAQHMIDHADVLPWEFAKLDAASMGHMNLTDYEFEYESSLQEGDIDRDFANVAEGLLFEAENNG